MNAVWRPAAPGAGRTASDMLPHMTGAGSCPARARDDLVELVQPLQAEDDHEAPSRCGQLLPRPHNAAARAERRFRGEQRRDAGCSGSRRPCRAIRLRDGAASISSRNVCCGLSPEATNGRGDDRSPSAGSTPIARPFRVRMRAAARRVADLAPVLPRCPRPAPRRAWPSRPGTSGPCGGRSKDRCDRWPKPVQRQVDLSHAVEEQQTGADDVVLEFLADEFQRRSAPRLEKKPPQGEHRAARAPLGGGSGGDCASGRMICSSDRAGIPRPSAARWPHPVARIRERIHGLVEVGPPLAATRRRAGSGRRSARARDRLAPWRPARGRGTRASA